ncbi:unnamed protein product, partial [Symbiodinium sp. CCMP2592]
MPPIGVVSDCTGYDTGALALHFLGVDFRLKMVSELDANVRALMHQTHRFIQRAPEAIALDMVSRERVEGVDLYISSCPCQDYS